MKSETENYCFLMSKTIYAINQHFTTKKLVFIVIINFVFYLKFMCMRNFDWNRKKFKWCFYKNNIHLTFDILGPLSNDRYAEIDDEVDVEQCSDSESTSRGTQRTSKTSIASPPCPSDEDRSTPEQLPVSSRVLQLRYIDNEEEVLLNYSFLLEFALHYK